MATNKKRPKKKTYKTKTRKNTAKPRKKANKKRKKQWQKKWKTYRQVFFEKLGMVTFVTLFVILMLFILTRSMDPSENMINLPSYDQEKDQKQAFVDTIYPVAQQLQKKYGIFASVSMAQAMLESDFGRSGLAATHYNLFGVKTDEHDPMGAEYKTMEFFDGEWVEISDYFKVYNSWAESMEAHAQLLTNGTTWDSSYYEAVTSGTTPVAQAQGLQEAGYATDPEYANKLIAMIREWDLQQYDITSNSANN